MADGVSSPYDEIDRVFEVVVDPLERSVDEGYGGVAVCGFSAEDTSWAITPMTG